MDIIAKRGTFGDFGRVHKGQVLKGVQKGLAEKLIAAGSYVEATDAALKEFEAKKKKMAEADKKRAAGEKVEMRIGIDAAALEKMFGEIRGALDAFREGIKADIDALKVARESETVAVGDLAGDVQTLKDAVSALAEKLDGLKVDGNATGQAGA